MPGLVPGIQARLERKSEGGEGKSVWGRTNNEGGEGDISNDRGKEVSTRKFFDRSNWIVSKGRVFSTERGGERWEVIERGGASWFQSH